MATWAERRAAAKKAKADAKAKRDLQNIAEGQRIARENNKKDRVAAQREKREQRRRNQGK